MGHVYIFLHGSPGTSLTWSEVVSRTPAGVDAIALDLPDHGAAADVVEIAPQAVERRLAEEVRERVGGRSFTLAGISYGAYLACRLADELAPSRLVLVAGLPRPADGAAEQFERLAAGVEAGVLGETELADLYRQLWVASDGNDAAEGYVAALARAGRPERLARQLRRMARIVPDGATVASFDVAAVALHGRRDPAVPLALGESLAGCGPDVPLEIIDTASHLLPLTHPERVARAVFGSEG